MSAWAALASLHLEAFQRDWLGELGIDDSRLPNLIDKAMKRPTPLAYQVEAERLVMSRRFDEAGPGGSPTELLPAILDGRLFGARL